MENFGKIIEKNDLIYKISFIRNSACSGCHNKNGCVDSECKEEIINVPVNSSEKSLQVGDFVRINVNFSGSLYKILFLLYVFPLIIMIITMYFLNQYKMSNLIQVLGIVLSLTISFSIVKYIEKSYIKKDKIKYRIEKIERD